MRSNEVQTRLLLGVLGAAVTVVVVANALAGPSTTGAAVERTGGSTSTSALGQPVRAISASEGHACAVTRAGAVLCWGSSVFGQLGNGSPAHPTVIPNSGDLPVPVRGLSTGGAAVSAGYYHSCALTRAGSVRCWGRSGDLGNGSSTNSAVPVAVSGLSSGVTAISAGLYNTCAVTHGGGVKCWGATPRPVGVKGLSQGVVAVSAAISHSCAVTRGGAARCWGQNGLGQLGNNRTAPLSLVPVNVVGLSGGVSAIGVGTQFTCALTRAGGVKCWGSNFRGALGNNSTENSLVPVDVSGLSSGVVAISVGNYHACAITRGGAVKCWGSNTEGQLGDGSDEPESPVPVDVTGLSSGVAAVSAADMYTCALLRTGAVQCWGNMPFGGKRSLVPVPVPGLGP